MIALYIIGGIILLIVILFQLPVRAEISYIAEKLDIKAKFLWVTIYPVQEKPPKKQKVRKKVKDEEADTINTATDEQNPQIPEEDDEAESKPSKLSKRKKERKKLDKDELKEKLDFFKIIIKSSKNGFKRFIKGTKIHDIEVDFLVANEDAYVAAMNYGKVNIAVYNTLAFLRTFFTVGINHINVSAGFNQKDSVYDFRCKVKVTPHIILITAISIFFNLLVNNYKSKKEKEKLNKGNKQERNGKK